MMCADLCRAEGQYPSASVGMAVWVVDSRVAHLGFDTLIPRV